MAGGWRGKRAAYGAPLQPDTAESDPMELKIDREFIRSERHKRGWSQEQLAAAAGLGVRTVQRIESSGTTSSESAKCLAAVFEVPLTRLFRSEPEPQRWRKRLWAIGVAAGLALASPLLLVSRANATDVAMAIVVETGITGESRINLEIESGRQTEIKLDRDLRLLLTPSVQKDGTILLHAEVHEWTGSDFRLASTPRVLIRQGVETGLKLTLGSGRSASMRITARKV